MDLKEISWVDMDWIDLALNVDRSQAFVNVVLNVWVLSNVGNFVAGEGMVKHFKKDSVRQSQSVSQVVGWLVRQLVNMACKTYMVGNELKSILKKQDGRTWSGLL